MAVNCKVMEKTEEKAKMISHLDLYTNLRYLPCVQNRYARSNLTTLPRPARVPSGVSK